MIAIENISKSFGEYVLFEDAGFKINTKERIGLVGRNGHGKTTAWGGWSVRAFQTRLCSK
jgi:ATP-binding cassette subfamily F protein 3